MTLNKKEQNIGVLISFLQYSITALLYIFLPCLSNEILLLSVLSAILIGNVILCIIVFRYYRKKSMAVEIDYLNIGTQRYILGLFMIFMEFQNSVGRSSTINCLHWTQN